MAVTKTLTLPEAAEMIMLVNVDEENRKLYLLFGDAQYLCVPVERIERAGRPVTFDLRHVELVDPYLLCLGTKEGTSEELPSDYLRYLADPAFARVQQEQDEASRLAFGRHLRSLRKRAKLSQKELAKRAGVSRLMISRLEQGEKHASIDLLRSLAKALGLPLVALLPGEVSE